MVLLGELDKLALAHIVTKPKPLLAHVRADLDTQGAVVRDQNRGTREIKLNIPEEPDLEYVVLKCRLKCSKFSGHWSEEITNFRVLHRSQEPFPTSPPHVLHQPCFLLPCPTRPRLLWKSVVDS